MILDDFVVLGKTVPEPTSDGRVFVCSAGYSKDIGGLIRVKRSGTVVHDLPPGTLVRD